MFKLVFRKERTEEIHEVENLVREAFWDVYQPGCCEHLLVHKLRTSPNLQKDLSFVATLDGTLAAGIWTSSAVIRTADGTENPVLTFGPLAVHPKFQRQGIGSVIVEHMLELAGKTSFPAVLIYGNPKYYAHFGFEPARKYGITTGEGTFDDALLVYHLKNAVPAGAFDEGEVFHLQPDEVRKFDADFPHREKHLRSSQLFFDFPDLPEEDPLFQQSIERKQQAFKLLRETKVLEAWEAIGAQVRLVGSLRCGLMMKHRDIDLHIYTDELDPVQGLQVMAQIASKANVTQLVFRDLANTDEVCLEYHVSVRNAEGVEWKLDMIQILAGSRYDGVIEHIAERIAAVITPETRRAVLELKQQAPDDEIIVGIEHYRAVLEGGVRTWPEFVAWRKAHPLTAELDLWEP